MTTATPQTPSARERSGILWFARECRQNDVRPDHLARSAERAGDRQLADFFRRAHAEVHGAEAA